MKILTILLILLQINTFGYGNYSSPYSNRYNSYSSVPVEQTNRKIGYTTNYSNGQFNSTQYYQGTYTPASSSSGGRPGQPRRIVVYKGDGTEEDTGDGKMGNPTSGMWIDGYEYYWDGHHWYRKDSEGTWSIWDSALDWGLIGWDWYNPGRWGRPNVPDNPIQYYQENPVPIEDPDFYLITALLFSYFIYIYMKKRRQQFLLYTGI